MQSFSVLMQFFLSQYFDDMELFKPARYLLYTIWSKKWLSCFKVSTWRWNENINVLFIRYKSRIILSHSQKSEMICFSNQAIASNESIGFLYWTTICNKPSYLSKKFWTYAAEVMSVIFTEFYERAISLEKPIRSTYGTFLKVWLLPARFCKVLFYIVHQWPTYTSRWTDTINGDLSSSIQWLRWGRELHFRDWSTLGMIPSQYAPLKTLSPVKSFTWIIVVLV